jgi:hypothetical protein
LTATIQLFLLNSIAKKHRSASSWHAAGGRLIVRASIRVSPMRWWEDRDRDGNLRPSRLHRIFLGYTGRAANLAARAACDPKSTWAFPHPNGPGSASIAAMAPSASTFSHGHEDMAPVAGAKNERKAAHMGSLSCVPRPLLTASGSDHSPLHQPERISRVRNRMLELGTSGSVGGEGGNLLAYPAPSSCKKSVTPSTESWRKRNGLMLETSLKKAHCISDRLCPNGRVICH